MAFAVGMGIIRESHGNGNKTPTWEWDWEGVGIYVNGNGNNPYSHGEKFPRFFAVADLH